MSYKPEIERLRRELFRHEREYPRGRKLPKWYKSGSALGGGVWRCDLSDDLLRLLPSAERETELRDFTDPLSVRLRPNGLGSYQFLDRDGPGGAIRRKVSIGLISTFAVDEARAIALRKAVEQIEHGRDVASRMPQSITFADAYQRYCRERWGGTPPFAKTLFDPLLAVIGDQQLRRIARDTVIDVIHRLSLANPNRAHELHKRARAFFSWCLKSSGVDYNPLSNVRLPDRTTRKCVHLNIEKLGHVYRAATTLCQPWRGLVQFIMLTGASVRRARTMRRMDVQQFCAPPLGWGSGSPPLGSVLSARAHAVLSNVGGGWRYYFESKRAKQRDQPAHLRPALLDILHQESGVSDWTWHDLVQCVRQNMLSIAVMTPQTEGGLLDAAATVEAWSETLEHFAFSASADPLEGVVL